MFTKSLSSEWKVLRGIGRKDRVFPKRVTIEGFFIRKVTITQFRFLELLLPLFLHDLQVDDALVLLSLRTQLVFTAQHGAKFTRYYWSSAVTPRPSTSWAGLHPRCRGGRLVRGWSLLQGVAASSWTRTTILLCTSYSRFPAQNWTVISKRMHYCTALEWVWKWVD